MLQINYTSGAGSEGLFFEEGPDPEPGDEEVLVRVAATALNRADLLQRRGQYPPPPGASPVLGLEMAGTVEAVGGQVDRWQPGDRVCGLLAGGGYAQYAVLHQDMALRLPEGMPWEEAAALPEAFLTAFQALQWLGRLKAGERVLLHAGASGVGTAAIQLARAMEAEVWVTASAPKHALCRDLGAQGAIDYRTEAFDVVIGRETGGDGVDLILDPVGAPYLRQNLELLKPNGRLVFLAFMGGARITDLSLGPLLRKRLTLIGTTLRSRPLAYKIALNRAFEAFAWPRFADGGLRAVIDRVMSWREAAEAHRLMEANANAGKIVLLISP